MGDSKPFAADENISIGCFWAAGAQVVSGRREDRGAGTLPALSHRVYLGGDLLCGQPADFVSNGKAGDCRIVLWRVCLGDDELRGNTALGHPSLAAQNRSGFNHYGTDLAYGPGRAADHAGCEPLGS